MTSARLMLEWAILLVLAIIGASWLHSSGSTSRIDNQILDYGAAFARPEVSSDIVVVTIDDQSLEDVGQWPWSRSTHAKLIDRLSEAGARLVVMDILFIDPSEAEADDALSQAISSNGMVALPHTFGPKINTFDEAEPILPLGKFRSASRAVGHVVAEPDNDGVLRRFDLNYELGSQSYPHLSVKVLEALELPVPEAAHEHDAVVPFHPSGKFISESAANVLSRATIEGVFADKIVLVGATGSGMGDRYSVASGSVSLMTGLETQANLLNALMQDALIHPVGKVWQDGLAALAMLFLFLSFWYAPPRFVLIAAIGVTVTALLVSAVLLSSASIWLAPSAIIITTMLIYPIWSWRRLSHASRYLEREARRLAGDGTLPGAQDGLDYVTRQIFQLRGIIRTVNDSLSFMRNIIEAAPDAILVLDRKGAVQMLNGKASQLFPHAKALDQTTFAEFLIFARAQMVREGSELETEDGRSFLIARAELDQTSEIKEAGSIIALRDVTELRELDNERQQMLEFLSHDMRTPQVAIVGLTQKAATPEEKPSPDTIRRIRLQAERTLKLADDFVQLARLQSTILQMEDSDISALVEEAVDRAYTQAEAKQITLDQSVPEEPCFATVDASLIARMLDNLIGNAIKYSDDGGNVSVTLEPRSDGTLGIIITDDGPGLSQARLTNPFARFGAHSTHAGPSAGLGLALVKKVIDTHNGTIDVHSAPGAGAKFVITLPGEVI